MKATDMVKEIGREYLIKFGTAAVACRVVDVRVSFGNLQLLVQPAGGMGQTWVGMGSVLDGVPVEYVRKDYDEPPESFNNLIAAARAAGRRDASGGER